MLLVTYQPKGWKQRKPDVKYDEIKEILGIPHDKTIYWCIPANNIQQCFLRSLGATPWMPAKFVMFETKDYYNIDGIRWNRNIELPQDFPLTEEIRKVDYPDMAEYIVTELPEKIFEVDIFPDAEETANPMHLTLKQILQEEPEIYRNYLQIIEKLMNYHAFVNGSPDVSAENLRFVELRRYMIAFQFTALQKAWQRGKQLLKPDEKEENQKMKTMTAKDFSNGSKSLSDIANGYITFWGTLTKEKAENADKLCQELREFYDKAYRYCFYCNPYSGNYTGNVNPKMKCPCGSGKPYKKCCMKYPEMPDIIQKMSDGFEQEHSVSSEIPEIVFPKLPPEAVYRIIDIETMHIVYIGNTKNFSANTLKMTFPQLEKLLFSRKRACVLQYYNGEMKKDRCIKTYFPPKNAIKSFERFHEIEMLNEEEQQNWLPAISSGYCTGDLLSPYGGIHTILHMLEKMKETGFEQRKYRSYQYQKFAEILWRESDKIENTKKNSLFNLTGNLTNGLPVFEIKPEFMELIENIYLDFCRFTNITYEKNIFRYIPEDNRHSSWFILRAVDTTENKIVFLKAFSVPEKDDVRYSNYLYSVREAINHLDNISYLIFDLFIADDVVSDKKELEELLCRMNGYYQPVYPFSDTDFSADIPNAIKWHDIFLSHSHKDLLEEYGGTFPNSFMIHHLKQTPYWQKIERMNEYQDFVKFAEEYSLFNPAKVIEENPEILSENVKTVLKTIRQKYIKLIEEKYRFMHSLYSYFS